MIPREQLLDKLEILQNIYVARSTHGPTDEQEYKQLRHDLLDDGRLGSRLPRFVRTSRTLDQFWMFIKPKFATYDERRQYIAEQFRPLVDELEGHYTGAEEQVESALKSLSADAVSLAWRKALERQATDPEGAITAARTLLESVCKHILDDARQEYGTDADLPKLSRLTAEHLKIAPSQHSESIFKQILGGVRQSWKVLVPYETESETHTVRGDAPSGHHRVTPASRLTSQVECPCFSSRPGRNETRHKRYSIGAGERETPGIIQRLRHPYLWVRAHVERLASSN